MTIGATAFSDRDKDSLTVEEWAEVRRIQTKLRDMGRELVQVQATYWVAKDAAGQRAVDARQTAMLAEAAQWGARLLDYETLALARRLQVPN
jgi:hypothetical protein